MIPGRPRLLPGRRQALLLAVLILAGGASLLLLPDNSRSYRAVATAVPSPDAPDCLQAAPDHTADDTVRERVARRARVPERELAGATEVLATPADAVLAVAFEADTAYAAQRGAYTTVSESVSNACTAAASALLLDTAEAQARLRAAEAAVEEASPLTMGPLMAARDEAAADFLTATEAVDRQTSTLTRSTSVTPAEPVGSRRSGVEELAVPAGAALSALLALAVLRRGWRRAAAPVPA